MEEYSEECGDFEVSENIIYQKEFYFNKFFISLQIARELWYISTEKERSYIYFGASKVKMNKYPNVSVYNVHLGPIVFRYFRDNGEVK